MAYATPSVIPGQALPPQTNTFTFADEVDKVIITTGAEKPVFSKTLGFDTGPVPPDTTPVRRPFLAVTQDGRGNVVYDAGYPKYLNGSIVQPPPTTFLGLNPGHRFLHNAIVWAANKAKVLKGNKSILVLDSSANGTDYDVAFPAIEGQGSLRVFQLVAGIAGFTVTVKNCTSYGGNAVNPTQEELDQYSCIILVSMYAPGSVRLDPRITPQGVNALVFARSTGTGIVVLTDHCNGNYSSMEDAMFNLSGFPTMAQAVVHNFGTWFTGNVDRANILVGDLIDASGDHPLYNGLARTDNIGASYSESLVMVVEHSGTPKDQVQPIPMLTDGEFLINVLVLLKDGSAYTESYRYFIITSGDVNIVDRNKSIVLNNKYTTQNQTFQLGLATVNPDYQSMVGQVNKNGTYMASFSFSNGNTTFSMPAGTDQTFTYKRDDDIQFQIREPFAYNLHVKIDMPQGVSPAFQQAGLNNRLRLDFPDLNIVDARLTANALAKLYYVSPGETPPLGPIGYIPHFNSQTLRFYHGQLKMANADVFLNLADFNARKPPFSSEGGSAILMDSNKVFVWRDHVTAWTEYTTTVQTDTDAVRLFGLGRIIKDKSTNKRYRVDATKLTEI